MLVFGLRTIEDVNGSTWVVFWGSAVAVITLIFCRTEATSSVRYGLQAQGICVQFVVVLYLFAPFFLSDNLAQIAQCQSW